MSNAGGERLEQRPPEAKAPTSNSKYHVFRPAETESRLNLNSRAELVRFAIDNGLP